MTVTGERQPPPGPAGPSGHGPVGPPRHRRRRSASMAVLAVILVGLVAVRLGFGGAIGPAGVRAWVTVFVSVVVQASPFLVLGTVLSAAIAAFVPPRFFARVLPSTAALAVPVAGAAGVILPGCECGSVPVATALVRRGVPTGAALAFLLSAPAINPVVLVATAVAFPGRPQMVLARLVASLLASAVMGWLWVAFGRPGWIRLPARPGHGDRHSAGVFFTACRQDLIQAGGFLVLGALCAATLNVTVPPRWLQAVAGNPVLSVLALAVLAVLLSICSQADAFVASALTQFSLTARLVFLVVGPLVDVKLFAMQAGAFGRRFALRFAPATFAVAVLSGLLTAWVLL